MRTTLLLADFAQVAEGKLSVLGGGWTFKGQGTPMAVAGLIEVSWDETDQPHHWTLRLVDADGQPVTLPGPDGAHVPVLLEGEIQVGRPPGHPIGVPFNVPLAINLGPLPLAPGERFMFDFAIVGRPTSGAQLAFSTHGAPPT